MNLFFENILAARDKNLDKLVPFLIVAVIVAVNVIKAIARKVKSTSQENAVGNKPVEQKKPSRYANAGGNYKTLAQMREEKISQIRATFGISPLMPEEFEEPEEELYVAPVVLAPPPPVPQRPAVVHKRKHSPVIDSLAGHHVGKAFSWKPLSTHGSKPAVKPADASKKISADIGDFCFSSPSDLRKAMLYREILGKPVSLID